MLYRKATMADIPAVHGLINDYAGKGLMLRRPIMYLYESVRDFVVAVEESTGELVGVGGLHIMWQDLAEIRSLAVKPGLTGKGVGKGIVEFLEQEGKAMGLKRLFALTYQKAFSRSAGTAWSRRRRCRRRFGRNAFTATGSTSATKSPCCATWCRKRNCARPAALTFR